MRRPDPLALRFLSVRPQRELQRQEPLVVVPGLGGGCVRVVLQQPAHHRNRRAEDRREVQRQEAAGLLGAGLRARGP